VDGECLPGQPLDCDDGLACTADWCNPALGCLNQVDCPEGQICDILGECCPNLECGMPGVECGDLQDGCGHTIDCGGCPDGQDCEGGSCVTPCDAEQVFAYGGHGEGTFVYGSYLLVATYSGGLHILDITVPEDPQVVSVLPLAGKSKAVVAAGDHAYVAASDAGLHVVDVANPAEPQLLGTADTPGAAWGVELSGDLAYVADMSGGVQVVNVANPSSPLVAGSYQTPGSAYRTDIYLDHLYVAGGSTGLIVLSLADPLNPGHVATYSTLDKVYDVEVKYSFAYLANGESGLRVLDVSTPSDPQFASVYSTGGLAWDVAIQQGHAVVSDGSEGLTIINVTNPYGLVWVQSAPEFSYARHVSFYPGYAFVACGYEGVRVAALPLPGGASLAAHYIMPREANDVYALGEYVYLGDINGFFVMEAGGAGGPQPVGHYDTAGEVEGVQVVGSYAYLGEEYAGALEIVDISVPAAPSLAGKATFGGGCRSMQVWDDYALCAVGTSGVRVFDVSDKSSPANIETQNTPGNAFDAQYHLGYVYVADKSTIQIMDASDPGKLQNLASVDMVDCRGLFVADDYLYAADTATANKGITVIDVNDPSTPAKVGQLKFGSNIRDLFIHDGVGFVAGGSSGFHILNLDYPASPKLVGSYPGEPNRVHYADGYAYLANGGNGLVLYQVLGCWL